MLWWRVKSRNTNFISRPSLYLNSSFFIAIMLEISFQKSGNDTVLSCIWSCFSNIERFCVWKNYNFARSIEHKIYNPLNLFLGQMFSFQLWSRRISTNLLFENLYSYFCVFIHFKLYHIIQFSYWVSQHSDVLIIENIC